jgi:hypothetical protein
MPACAVRPAVIHADSIEFLAVALECLGDRTPIAAPPVHGSAHRFRTIDQRRERFPRRPTRQVHATGHTHGRGNALRQCAFQGFAARQPGAPGVRRYVPDVLWRQDIPWQVLESIIGDVLEDIQGAIGELIHRKIPNGFIRQFIPGPDSVLEPWRAGRGTSVQHECKKDEAHPGRMRSA